MFAHTTTQYLYGVWHCGARRFLSLQLPCLPYWLPCIALFGITDEIAIRYCLSVFATVTFTLHWQPGHIIMCLWYSTTEGMQFGRHLFIVQCFDYLSITVFCILETIQAILILERILERTSKFFHLPLYKLDPLNVSVQEQLSNIARSLHLWINHLLK